MSTVKTDTIKVDTIKTTGNVEVYTCKAWVNFDGTQTAGNMIRASGNVSSITDNSTGNYYVNFTASMSDVNYAASLNHGDYGSASYRGWDILFNQETNRVRVETRNESGGEVDSPLVCVSVFR
jgi:hypothetical protein